MDKGDWFVTVGIAISFVVAVSGYFRSPPLIRASRISELRDIIIQLRAEIAEFKNEKSDLKNQIKELKNQVNSLMYECEFLRNQYRSVGGDGRRAPRPKPNTE